MPIAEPENVLRGNRNCTPAPFTGLRVVRPDGVVRSSADTAYVLGSLEFTQHSPRNEPFRKTATVNRDI